MTLKKQVLRDVYMLESPPCEVERKTMLVMMTSKEADAARKEFPALTIRLATNEEKAVGEIVDAVTGVSK